MNYRLFFWYILTGFYFSTTISFAQSLIYPDITNDRINNIVFTDNATGYFINESGSIYKTTDGGISWKMNINFSGSPLRDIKFTTKQKGFTFSPNTLNPFGGMLASTEDGGDTWKSIRIDFSDGLKFLPLSDNTLLKSTNEGEIKLLNNFYGSWKTTYKMKRFNFILVDAFNKVQADSDANVPYGRIESFYKSSDSLVYAFGASENALNYEIIKDSVNFVLKSTDNGNSWDTVWTGFNFAAKKMVFQNKLYWWLLGEKDIYKTENGGVDWEKMQIDSNRIYNYSDIFIVDSSKLYVIQNYSRSLFYSTDAGINWKSEETNLPFGRAYKIYFVNSSKGFAYGNDIFITKDGGISWNPVSQSIRDDIIAIDFINKQKGWVLGSEGLYFTNDGGHDWFKKEPPKITFSKYNGRASLQMVDSLNGWLNNADKVYKTIDGGNNWNEVIIEPNLVFGRLKFCNKYKGIIYNVHKFTNSYFDTSFIFTTTNGGNSWIKHIDTLNKNYDDFRDLEFSDSSKLWAINTKGIWLSTDMGDNWKLRYNLNMNSNLQSIYFLDSKNGFASIGGDKMIRTKDGGNTWQIYYLNSHILPIDLIAIGPNNFIDEPVIKVFSPGYDGSLIKLYFGTKSNFYRADRIPSYTSGTIRSFSSYIENNKPNVWIAGDGFNLLYREYEKIISDVKIRKGKQSSTKYTLSQNYPNPFNPSTTIQYEIPESGRVTLKVYDILGREVKTLLNKYQNSGSYELNFNASNLASGIYFYKLTSGDFISIKKMIILK